MHFNNFLISTTFLLLLCNYAWSGRDLSQKYKFIASLSGDDYVLYWNIDRQSKQIEFGVNVSTTGWVGFGLSHNGQMPGSDVVIGWVDNTGEVTFHDRFAATRSLPAIDESQDWFITRGSEESGRTILEFYRNFTTCDDNNDMDIKADTARVVWSYNSNDPSSFSQLAELIHEKKGSSSLNLLGGLSEDHVESDNESIQILNENVLIPSDDTTYWCTVHELPDAIEQQERYLYKISPVIYGPTATYVHHIIAYLCTNLNDTHVGASQQCSGTGNIDIKICRRTGIIFAAWAVGGTDFIFPDGVGYPFGGKGNQYIVLEFHYNNPKLDAGMVDNSGLEFFYVSEEPANRAGLLTFGQQAASNMMIPPQASNYVVNAICPEQCSQEFFPKEGINIFANLLHTHLAGHGLVVRHLRRTSTCSGLEELPPIDANMRYDFNYQQTTYLPRTVTVLPGDILQLECSYRTTDSAYQTMVLGGESTREEMCFSFFYYYPETEMNFCLGQQVVSDEFTMKNFNKTTQASLFKSIWRNDQKAVKNIFKEINWDSETIELFQASVHSNDYHASCIDSTNVTASISTSVKLPEVKCPYVPPIKDCPVSASIVDSATHEHFYAPLVFISMLSLWFTL